MIDICDRNAVNGIMLTFRNHGCYRLDGSDENLSELQLDLSLGRCAEGHRVGIIRLKIDS